MFHWTSDDYANGNESLITTQQAANGFYVAAFASLTGSYMHQKYYLFTPMVMLKFER